MIHRSSVSTAEFAEERRGTRRLGTASTSNLRAARRILKFNAANHWATIKGKVGLTQRRKDGKSSIHLCSISFASLRLCVMNFYVPWLWFRLHAGPSFSASSAVHHVFVPSL